MEIRSDKYKGAEAFILENIYLRVIVLKNFGAKVASIYNKKQNFEVLFQPVNNEYTVPLYGDSFEKYDTSGWDEAYPTIDKCLYPFETKHKGIEMPDHGELWSIPWNFTVEEGKLKSWVASPKFNYIFTRYIELRENTIHVEYEIKNIGDENLYAIWTLHSLLACDQYSKLILKNVHKVINVHKSEVLGNVGTVHNYPMTKDVNGNNYSLDKINPVSCKKSEKFYVKGKLLKGEAGITLNKEKILLTINFPEKKIPYLGIWINEGGFKGEYNCAIEPANGFYDSVETAKRYNEIDKINPKGSNSWFLDITLKEI
ncbi:MAG: DUF5107 domain-containing protein [Bacillota bacterium]|nr:DUF5107 domain-containing protein [Bacillota bacterium]